MPLPGKDTPVLHVYTTSDSEKAQFLSATQDNCFQFDGIEGYLAPSNMTGTLEMIYRLYNSSADSYILVPSSKLSIATSLGYTQDQTALGWAIPNIGRLRCGRVF